MGKHQPGALRVLWGDLGPSSSSALSAARKSCREGGSGAGGGSAPHPTAPWGAERVRQAHRGFKVIGGLHRAWRPQNSRRWAGNTPAEGRALGSCLKVLEGNLSLFCAIFQPQFAPRNAVLADGSRRGVCGGSCAQLGVPGQEFGAGTPTAAAFVALPALPSPGLPSAGSQTSPRRLGHWPLFRRIKLALLLSLSLFQQFLPPLSLSSGETFLPGGCQEKYPPEGHAGTGTGSTALQGHPRDCGSSTPTSAPAVDCCLV